MQPTVYQKPEIRDANDNIIQQGAFSKNTALCTATNDGWIDYVANDLEFLYDLAKDEVVPVPSLPASGQMNKTYLLTTTGVSYRWSGTEWVAVSSSEAVGRAETAANLAEQWATKTDGTVDGTEYSAKYYAEQAEASADDAQDVADDMADHLVQIDKNTGGVSKNSKRISNIEKLLQGNLYDYDTDDDEAYVKDVPSGALPYAGVEKIGGKTLVWNQLFNRLTDRVAQTTYGVTWSFNASTQEVTLSGEASQDGQFRLYVGNGNALINGHKLYVASTESTLSFRLQGNNTTVDGSGIITAGASTIADIALNVQSGVDYTGKVTKFNVIDLTLMFGSGNEPSTVAEFQQMFPSDYYPYNAGTLLSAGVTGVVSKDSNDVTLQTLSIPAEVQALDGYGWSAGTAYNYIDFERKVFVKRVDRVVLNGTQNISTVNWRASDNGVGWIYPYSLTSNALTPTNVQGNLVTDSANIPAKMYYSLWSSYSYGVSLYNTSGYGLCLRQSDTTLTTASAINTYLSANPITVYYELATPVETDISQYLTDNLIEIGTGGTLTFPNSNGDDYHIPVPSEVTYMIDLQEAIENGN